MSNFKYSILATDTAVLSFAKGELLILLIKAQTGPFKGQWALPGRLVKPDENLEESVVKRLSKYLKLSSFYLEQLYTFGSLKRDPSGRIVSVSYLMITKYISTQKLNGAIWVPIKKLSALAYDHNEIVKLALQRLRDKLSYTNICFVLMADAFTLGELQKTYEIILGRKLDKRNFRKKIFSTRIVKFVGKMKKGEPNRPARLYKFTSSKLENVEIL